MKFPLMGIALLYCLFAASQLKSSRNGFEKKEALIDSLVNKEMSQQHILGLSLGIVVSNN
ncbi:MAG: hypothetical protein EOP45_16155 [Sphingobacteriaceae bacterium]|nr:MAG: hypothetical protein EOP45_16155 [Sphingobacteriaceae bacterium]